MPGINLHIQGKTLRYLVDLGLLICFCLIAVTGLIKFMTLYRWFGVNNLLLPNYQISVIHDWTGLVIIMLILIHLALHFRWLVGMTKRFLGRGGSKSAQ